MSDQNYTVKPGDTLQKIAARQYGNRMLWRTIYNANREAIGANPDLIREGQMLFIPPEKEVQEARAPKPEVNDKKTATVFLNGREIMSTQGRAAFALDSLAASWNCDCLWNPGKDTQFDKDTARGSFAEAQLYLFGQLMASGRLYTRTALYGTNGITKNLVFYSITKDIVDSSLSPTHPEYANSTLQQIAGDICGALGYQTKFPDGAGEAFTLIEGVPVYETVGKYLQKLASERGMFISCDENSALVFQKLNTTGRPVANIDITGRTSTEYQTTYDDTLRFHNYVAVGEAGDGKNLQSKGFTDPQVPSARQFVFEAPQSDAENLDIAAQWVMLKITLQANEIKIPSDKWCDDNGNLWKPNTIVTVKSPVLDIPTSRKYIIRGVEFVWTASSRNAELSLIPILSVDASGVLRME
jgi:murein DD-endopeptidase MepM/ murein hydrolase activator NlpD